MRVKPNAFPTWTMFWARRSRSFGRSRREPGLPRSHARGVPKPTRRGYLGCGGLAEWLRARVAPRSMRQRVESLHGCRRRDRGIGLAALLERLGDKARGL